MFFTDDAALAAHSAQDLQTLLFAKEQIFH